MDNLSICKEIFIEMFGTKEEVLNSDFTANTILNF